MLHNELEDMKGKIRVICRVRPLSERETEKRCVSVVKIVDECTINVEGRRGVRGYTYDKCFGPGAA